MEKRQLITDIEYYESEATLEEADALLLKKAKSALEKAYAPYSEFLVGCALRLKDGRFVLGNNQENASYPQGICAERVALFYAGAEYPDQPVVSLAVTVKNLHQVIPHPASPCGGCRQVIAETEFRYKQPIRIILQGETGPVVIVHSAEDLLPLAFNSDYLKKI